MSDFTRNCQTFSQTGCTILYIEAILYTDFIFQNSLRFSATLRIQRIPIYPLPPQMCSLLHHPRAAQMLKMVN